MLNEVKRHKVTGGFPLVDHLQEGRVSLQSVLIAGRLLGKEPTQIAHLEVNGKSGTLILQSILPTALRKSRC